MLRVLSSTRKRLDSGLPGGLSPAGRRLLLAAGRGDAAYLYGCAISGSASAFNSLTSVRFFLRTFFISHGSLGR